MASDDLDLDAIEARARAATPGLWESDTDSDRDIDWHWQRMLGPDGKALFDSLNSDVAVIHEERDEDGRYAWDETAERNFAHIAGMCPATTLRLVAEMRADKARIRKLEAELLHMKVEHDR